MKLLPKIIITILVTTASILCFVGLSVYFFIKSSLQATLLTQPELSSQVDSLALQVALITGIAIIATSLIILFFVQQFFIHPISLLIKDTEAVGKGDFHARIKFMSHDELGQLAKIFNQLTDTLEEVYINMEQKVQRTTAQLADTIKELAADNAKDNAILSSIGDGMIVIDTQADILKINDIAKEMLAIGDTAVIGKKIYSAFQKYDTDGNVVPKELNPGFIILQTGKAVSEVFMIHKQDRSKHFVSITGNPIMVDGKILGGIMTIRDVTKEKEIDRMKTEFISLASHQLRTPLSAIRWFSEMLLGGDGGELTPEQKEFAQNIASSTERMIQLVNSLLNISRIESGRIVIDPKLTNLKTLVEGVVTDLKSKLQEKQHHLVISVHPDLPLISIDPRLISQVYMNLLTNAIKYTAKGGEISVFISRKDDMVISQVSDNGYGIPKHAQERVFQKFFRAENVASFETDGTGLGLYLIKAIVESSLGKIWFESYTQEKDVPIGKHGTTFWFSLPITGTPPKAGEVTLDN